MTGWHCVSHKACIEIYSEYNDETVFHCDDESCTSGVCFRPKSGFGQNKDSLRCNTLKPDTNYSLHPSFDPAVDGPEPNFPGKGRSAAQCRLGYKKREVVNCAYREIF